MKVVAHSPPRLPAWATAAAGLPPSRPHTNGTTALLAAAPSYCLGKEQYLRLQVSPSGFCGQLAITYCRKASWHLCESALKHPTDTGVAALSAAATPHLRSHSAHPYDACMPLPPPPSLTVTEDASPVLAHGRSVVEAGVALVAPPGERGEEGRDAVLVALAVAVGARIPQVLQEAHAQKQRGRTRSQPNNSATPREPSSNSVRPRAPRLLPLLSPPL